MTPQPPKPRGQSTSATPRKRARAPAAKAKGAAAEGGRPSKFTPELRERILQAVRAGVPRTAAAQSAGIGETTLYRYLQIGRSEHDGRHRDFLDAVVKAEADAQVHAVASWRRAIAAGDWRAAESYLARRHPSDWARRGGEQASQDGPGRELEEELGQLLRTGPQADLTKLSERQLDELEAIRRALRR